LRVSERVSEAAPSEAAFLFHDVLCWVQSSLFLRQTSSLEAKSFQGFFM